MSLGLTLCPGGPVVPFSMGRKNATAASPPDLVALPDQSVTQLLERMAGGFLRNLQRRAVDLTAGDRFGKPRFQCTAGRDSPRKPHCCRTGVFCSRKMGMLQLILRLTSRISWTPPSEDLHSTLRPSFGTPRSSWRFCSTSVSVLSPAYP